MVGALQKPFLSDRLVSWIGLLAYLSELSNTAIDPQRVRRDAGNSVARLAQLPQRGSTWRGAGVQGATASGTAARGRFRLRALSYYACARRRCNQNRRGRHLTRATVMPALHAFPESVDRSLLLTELDWSFARVIVLVSHRMTDGFGETCVKTIRQFGSNESITPRRCFSFIKGNLLIMKYTGYPEFKRENFRSV